MSVALLISNADDVAPLLPWALRFGAVREGDVCVVHVTAEGDAEVRGVDLEAAGADDLVAGQIVETAQGATVGVLRTAVKEDPHPLITSLAERGVSLLIIPRTERPRGDDPVTVFERQLFMRASCDTMMLRPGERPPTDEIDVVIPTAGGGHSRVALRLGVELSRAHGGRASALYVEPRIGRDAELVGHRIVDRIVKRTLTGDSSDVARRVVVSDDVHEGIGTAVAEDTELVLAGTSYLGTVKRMLFGTLSERLFNREGGPAVGVVRRATPLASRLRQTVDRWLGAAVPQLDREGRLTLVERVQSNSHFDFDFVALLGLSTLIAALGLLQSAAAVIIGAMLVAPLMTPLVGTGLALVQGNLRLVRNATRSVAAGFCLAFLLGAILGWTLGETPTQEMLARTSPGPLDLVVALLSGVAAAYASSRPHLSAALPGVAIAAALVPPIATAGLAFATGFYRHAGGAALLFATNMVAIILGSAATLWAVGFRGTHEHGRLRAWTTWGLVSVIVLAVLTASALGDRDEIPTQLRDEILAMTRTHLDSDDVTLTLVDGAPPVLHVVVAAATDPSRSVALQMRSSARRLLSHDVEVRLQRVSIVETR